MNDRTEAECPSWCYWTHPCVSDLHHPQTGHYSARYVLPIDEMVEIQVVDGIGFGPVTTYLYHSASEASPRVWLSAGETDTGFSLTVHETRELGKMLYDLADLAALDEL